MMTKTSAFLAAALAATITQGGAEAIAGEPAAVSLAALTDKTWRAVFTLETPAESLAFNRVTDDARTRRWRALDEDFEIVHGDDGEFIRRKDGEAFTEAAFAAPTGFYLPPKDYLPFSKFGDGGVLIYTGQFQACAETCETGAGAAPLSWPLEIVAPDVETILVNGEALYGIVRWRDTGDGSKIYVGDAKPVETASYIGVIDARFPAHIADALLALFPEMMAFYADRLAPLAHKPVLFASYDEGDSPERIHAKGGTLRGQVFMHLYGPAWKDPAENAFVSDWVAWFFAHEAAHLYQRGADKWQNQGEAWIHEGGAEAFAALLTQATGDVDYVEQRVNESYTDCIHGMAHLDGAALNKAAAYGVFDNYYACGLLLHLALDASLKRTSDGEKGLFDIWRAFLARLDAGESWTQETFLAAAADAGAPQETIDFLNAVAEEPQTDFHAFMSDGLAAAGLSLTADDY